MYDERPDQPVLLPPVDARPPFQVVASPCPGRSEPSEFDDHREGPQQPGQPIIIHPPPQTHITPSPYGPPGPGIIVPPSHPWSCSTTPTTTASPRPSVFPPTMFLGAPLPGAAFPGGLLFRVACFSGCSYARCSSTSRSYARDGHLTYRTAYHYYVPVEGLARARVSQSSRVTKTISQVSSTLTVRYQSRTQEMGP